MTDAVILTTSPSPAPIRIPINTTLMNGRTVKFLEPEDTENTHNHSENQDVENNEAGQDNNGKWPDNGNESGNENLGEPDKSEERPGNEEEAAEGTEEEVHSIGGKVILRNVEEEMKNSYINYAMSVIIGRALPDVRDGLKPVHRRILYGMYESGSTSNKPYKKCARIVGDVMGKYHPHGDQAIYDTLVRMAQDFSMRYPLIDGQGNFGSMDGDKAAAMRYTESRLNKAAEELLADIEKNTVNFVPNYDGSLKEPVVLPARFPNLLINGSAGIAVGMATRIPPHNLTEVINALVAIIENPEIDVLGLMEYIKGPDFPTGGIIHGRGGIVQAYTTGRGSLSVRARTHIEEMKNGRQRIIVDEIPYQVNKAELIKSIAGLVKDKRIEGISDLRDESDRDGIRVVIELKKAANSEIVLNQLYKHTQMQDSFGIINLALVNDQPRVLTLKEMLVHFLNHRHEVVERRTQFELEKAEKRAHIVEGLLIALKNIDEVIAIIRKSRDANEARAALTNRFELSEAQTKAILDMRLQKLTSLETEALEKEFNELWQAIENYREILESREKRMAIIRDELIQIRDKYGDGRRTEIVEFQGDLEIEDLIADEPVILTITREGYIKRQAMDTYRSQKRGGKGVVGTRTREEDFVADIFTARTHDYLMCFTNHGRVYWLKVWRVPDAGRYSLGRALVNMLPALESGEKVNVIIPVREFDDEHYLIFATRNGTVKKTRLSAFSHPRRVGVKAILLDEEDELVEVRLSSGEEDIMLATRLGKAIRFREKEVRAIGRTARGVRGIRLAEGDDVMDMLVVSPNVVSGTDEDDSGDEENGEPETEDEVGEVTTTIPGDVPILTITEFGYGKRTYLSRYRRTRRGGKGIYTIRITDRNGPLRAFKVGPDGYALMVTTVQGMVIRTTTSDIRIMGRQAQGVKVIRLNEGDRVAGVTLFEPEIEGEEDTGTVTEEKGGDNAIMGTSDSGAESEERETPEHTNTAEQATEESKSGEGS